MKSNQQKLDDLHWETSNEGRDFISRRALSEVTYPNAWGDRFPLLTIINGIERRQAENNAAITALVATIGKLAGGESFDKDAMLADVRAAVKDAIESITVTVKGE